MEINQINIAIASFIFIALVGALNYRRLNNKQYEN